MQTLADQHALVTGGGRGIGIEITQQLILQGAKVTIKKVLKNSFSFIQSLVLLLVQISPMNTV
jgi:short-subunit dehydrogenase involved in D-alanine esterification of teichoic acids